MKGQVKPELGKKRNHILHAALEESGGDQEYATLPEQHRFPIPGDAHWQATRTKVTNVGKAIQDALRTIETANPDTLYGVFGDAQWTNKDRLADALLKDMLEHPATIFIPG